MKKIVYVTNTQYIRKDIAEGILAEKFDLRFVDAVTEDDLILKCADANAIVITDPDVTAKAMDGMPNLEYISGAIIGFNTVDVEAAKQRGIPVSNNPKYCTNEVADHAAAFILSLARRIIDYNEEVHVKKMYNALASGYPIHRLSTQTLGLIGFGSISRALTIRMKGFGMNIIAYDPYVTKEQGILAGVEIVDMPELCKRSDIISLHLPHMKSTDKIINKSVFDMMERKPIFVNCARGGVVDEDALVEAVKEGKVSLAGLDVVTNERVPIEDNPLTKQKNIIMTPHAAFYSIEARIEQQELGCKHVLWFYEGKYDQLPIVNGVKPQAAKV
ncbi:MAG: C-terminal binding protein [Eubacteriaceae bacterium]|nr:C-terminal binding protein [Eubacteriaceae bacterium]